MICWMKMMKKILQGDVIEDNQPTQTNNAFLAILDQDRYTAVLINVKGLTRSSYWYIDLIDIQNIISLSKTQNEFSKSLYERAILHTLSLGFSQADTHKGYRYRHNILMPP